MTPEERDRLAKLEARFEGLDDWMRSIAADVKDLRAVAHTGQGALRMSLKIGAWVAGLIAAAAAIATLIEKLIALLKH